MDKKWQIKSFCNRMRGHIAAGGKWLKKTAVPYLRKNLCNRQFLIFAAAVFLISFFSFPEKMVDFDSSTLRPWFKIAGLLLNANVMAGVLTQMTLILLFYALLLFLPVKVRSVLNSLFMTWVMIFTLGNAYMVFRYSCPASEMVIIINSADTQEVREFFSSLFLNNKILFFSSIIFCSLLPVLMIWFFIRTKAPERPAVFAGIMAGLALLVYLLTPAVFALEFWRDIRAVNFLYQLNEKDFFLSQAAEITAAPQLPDGSKDALKGRVAVTGVVVLGESDNRHHHSLYGYSGYTDVMMEKYRGKPGFFIFKDVMSATSSTQHSIYFMFSDARISDKWRPAEFALCEWFQAAGASVLWYSNQRAHGAWASMAALMFAHADELKFFADGTENTYDRVALLPPVMKRLQELRSYQQPVFFGVHIMGNHYDQNFRIDPAWRKENADKLKSLDIYDQTVVYNDNFLATLTAEIEAIEKPAFLLYMPDHSELPESSRSLRASDPVYYEIPVFLYCNKAYQKAFPEIIAALCQACNKPYQTDLALYLIARLMNMPVKLIPAEIDILSEKYRPAVRWIGFGEVKFVEKQ